MHRRVEVYVPIVLNTMSTTDAWKFAKIAKYGLLPRILAFGQRRTDGLHTALRTNSSSVASTSQSDPRLIRASTIRQVQIISLIIILSSVHTIFFFIFRSYIDRLHRSKGYASSSIVIDRINHFNYIIFPLVPYIFPSFFFIQRLNMSITSLI